MKGGLAAAAVAAMATGAQAALPQHRRAHDLFRRGGEVCVPTCTTVWTTYHGQPTLVPNPPSAPKPTKQAITQEAVKPKPTTVHEVPSYEAPKPVVPTTTTAVVEVHPVPTPEEYKCPTPGTYTFPATTMTVTESTTVCVGETTKVPAGTHTMGGITTIVETATTVTCPYAKETEHEGVVTSVIETTTYVCPSAGTYTIAPITKTCEEETVLVYPVPTSYVPGTYTAPEQVVTVTETDYVYVCPYSQSGVPATTKVPETPKAPEAPKPQPPKEKPTKPAYEAPKPTAPVYEVPSKAPEASKKPEAPVYSAPETPVYTKPAEEKPSEAPKPKPKPVAPKKPSTPGNLKGGNDHYGITYTPYEASTGDCKSGDQVDKDIGALKQAGFQIIRSYSTDCDTLETVAPACKKHGIDMIIGVFVKASGCSYETPEIKEQVDAIAKWAQWDQVKLFTVGNEAIMNNFCTPQELKELIEVVKEKCSGYNGPYTIAETLNIWQREDVKSTICPSVDVTGANIHPYFNPDTAPKDAGEFVAGQLDLLRDICEGNDVINLECGWPSSGNCNGVACPGKKEQAEAIESIRESCGDKTVFFSYENDMWKEPGSCNCERSWGCASSFSGY
ncbi:beta-glucosidase [Fusarium heterosporum]|uniref:Probable beta-glucosidase btgE n=1 Tax=Fusarium heterosporum TaxID=42747 RepID=A0A8H5SZM8_FUSHE|nr:beta-glucosidase [Fusarium heterosporum]